MGGKFEAKEPTGAYSVGLRTARETEVVTSRLIVFPPARNVVFR